MSYVLLLVLYSGNITMNDYSTKAACEQALLVKWDLGQMKSIKTLECVIND